MADSVYKVIELVGTSTDSWERAAARRSIRPRPRSETSVSPRSSSSTSRSTRTARKTYRAKLSVSFKYEGGA